MVPFFNIFCGSKFKLNDYHYIFRFTCCSIKIGRYLKKINVFVSKIVNWNEFLFECYLKYAMDVDWHIGSRFDYSAGGPRFDWMSFLEALISLFPDNWLQNLFL